MSKKYLDKQNTIEAIQWTGKNEKSIISFLQEIEKEQNFEYQLDIVSNLYNFKDKVYHKKFLVIDDEDVVYINDWIIYDLRDWRVVKDKDFKKRFIKIKSITNKLYHIDT